MSKPLFTALLLATAFPIAALAAGEHGHRHAMPASHGHMTAAEHAAMYGQPGDPKKVSRTVEVVLSDDMRFTPEHIEVQAGETIRFVVRNSGQVDHEMVLGQMAELQAHALEMRANPGMVHAEPNQLYLQPGQQGELVWHFTTAGKVDIACTIPGHLEAGMVGAINVAP